MNASEAEGDLTVRQTSLLFYVNAGYLVSWHKNNLIYTTKAVKSVIKQGNL